MLICFTLEIETPKKESIFFHLILFRYFIFLHIKISQIPVKMTSSIEVTPENFVHAVQMLYHDQDATRKKMASEWLLNVQSSVIIQFFLIYSSK